MSDKNIDFGIDWDVDTLIEKELPTIQERSEPVKKMTIREKREMVKESLIEALRTSDKEELLSLHKNHKVLSNRYLHYIIVKSIFQNFNSDMAATILDNGFYLDENTINDGILRNKSLNILKFFIDRANLPKEREKAKNANKERIDFYKYHIRFSIDDKDFLEAKTEFESNFEYNISLLSLFKKLLSEEKKDDFVKKSIEYMLDNVERLGEYAFKYDDNLYNFLNSVPLKDNDFHKSILSRLDSGSWDRLFDINFNFSHNSTFTCSIENIIFLTQYLKENDIARKSWNRSQKKREEKFKKWESWWDKYYPDRIEFDDVPLVKKLSSMSLDLPKDKPLPYYFERDNRRGNEGSIIVRKEIMSNYFTDYKLSVLDITLALYTRLFFNLSANIDFVNDLIDKSDANNVFESNPPSYISPTFMHLLVDNASPALSYVLKTKDGCNAVEKCMESIYTKCHFLIKTNQDIFMQVMRKIPSLKEYRFDNGDTLAHIFIKNQNSVNKTFAKSLLVLYKDDFIQKNNEGKSLLDVCKLYLSQKDWAELESDYIKRSLKSQGVSGVKLRSRTKYSSSKKKM